MKEADLHSAHRKRMREKIKKAGIQAFADHECLEFLLFAVIPRADTNATAHRLLKKFGNMLGVFSASYNELISVAGVGDKAALHIINIGEMYKRTVCEHKDIFKLKNTLELKEYAISLFKFETVEKCFAVCLDDNMFHLATIDISTDGALTHADIDATKAVKKIYSIDPTPKYVVLMHNHIENSLNISTADGRVTSTIAKLLRPFNVFLDDHIIVSHDETLSFKEIGAMEKVNEIATKANITDEILKQYGFGKNVASNDLGLDKFIELTQ